MLDDISAPESLRAPAPLTTLPADIHPPEDMADLVLAYLEQLGIDYVFGVPGGAIEPLYNALARSERRGGIRHVLARHEAGAGFMADGYARETGKIGVCIATSGPGATNLITAVATAHANNVPMLVITGQPALPSFGRHSLQESACTGINVVGMFRHCTRYNSLVSHPKQLEAKLIEALQCATRTPRGPVHLAIPVDLLRSPSPVSRPTYNAAQLLRAGALVDEQAVSALAQLLAPARKVVLLIGGGCGEAIGTVLQFAEQRGAGFVTTPDGKGLVSPHHPLFRGVFGFAGHQCAEDALADPSVDLIIAAGASMGEWNTGGWSSSLLNERLVHIDESEEHLARTPMARLHVRGSLDAIFTRLVALGAATGALAQRQPAPPGFNPDLHVASPQACASEAAPITPQRLMRELSLRFPAGTRFLADAGNSIAWAIHYLHPQPPVAADAHGAGGGWLRVTMSFAPMGWAIGGAVGTAIANPSAPAVCITGDGSFLMNGQEISAAVAENLCVVFVVLNDSSLGMVKHGQRLAGAERIATEMPATDFAAMARAQGAQAFAIRSPADFAALDMGAICRRPGPTLLDVYIDGEQVPPMNSRVRVLAEDGQ